MDERGQKGWQTLQLQVQSQMKGYSKLQGRSLPARATVEPQSGRSWQPPVSRNRDLQNHQGRTRLERRERTMRKLILFSSFVVVVLFAPYYGWTQERQVLHTPVITHAYAIDKGPNGTVWKIYIEAEDAGGDMNYVIVTADQTGQGRYPADRVLLDPRHRSHLKGFLQWNRVRPGAPLAEGTQIRVRVSIADKARNVSNEVVFPITFVSGISAQQDIPAPFDEIDIPWIGYVGVHDEKDDYYYRHK